MSDGDDKRYGLTADDCIRLSGLLLVLGYENRVPEFVDKILSDGLPSQKEVAIKYHERKLRELRNLP